MLSRRRNALAALLVGVVVRVCTWVGGCVLAGIAGNTSAKAGQRRRCRTQGTGASLLASVAWGFFIISSMTSGHSKMAFIHTESITRACAELNPGESYVYNFPTPKDAHNEYCYFRTALRAAVQKIPAAKTLSISRNGSSVIISMGYPAVLYPKPTRVSIFWLIAKLRC